MNEHENRFSGELKHYSDGGLLELDVDFQRQIRDIERQRDLIKEERVRRMGRIASNVIPFPIERRLQS